MADTNRIAYKTGKKRLVSEVKYVKVEKGFTQVYDALTEIMPHLSFSSNGDLFLMWICVRAVYRNLCYWWLLFLPILQTAHY